MNENKLKRLFPNASPAFVRANSDSDIRETPKLESTLGHAALAAPQAQEEYSERFFVRVTSVRKRLLDPDNLAEKYHLDCCRYAGLLPGDSSKEIDLQTTQRKALKGEEEHTQIEIIPL